MMLLDTAATQGEGMANESKKESARFPLRLPPELDTEVRKLARGDGKHPPAGINDTILFLIREGLKAIGKETEPGPWVPELLQAA